MTSELLLIAELFKKYNLVGDIHAWAHQNKHNIFGIPYSDSLTFDEWLELIEDDEKQRTVVLSARISYDVIKYYLATKVNKFFSRITECDIQVISVKTIKNEDFLACSFDLVISLNGKLIPFEIKFTQDEENFSGATHSTKKVKNYLLFHFKAKRDVKLNSDETFFDSVFAMVAHFGMDKWVGKPKKNSSFSSLKLASNMDYTGQIISGGLKKNRKWCKLLPAQVEFTQENVII